MRPIHPIIRTLAVTLVTFTLGLADGKAAAAAETQSGARTLLTPSLLRSPALGSLRKEVATTSKPDVVAETSKWVAGAGTYWGSLYPHYDIKGAFYKERLIYVTIANYSVPGTPKPDLLLSYHTAIDDRGAVTFGDSGDAIYIDQSWDWHYNLQVLTWRGRLYVFWTKASSDGGTDIYYKYATDPYSSIPGVGGWFPKEEPLRLAHTGPLTGGLAIGVLPNADGIGERLIVVLGFDNGNGSSVMRPYVVDDLREGLKDVWAPRLLDQTLKRFSVLPINGESGPALLVATALQGSDGKCKITPYSLFNTDGRFFWEWSGSTLPCHPAGEIAMVAGSLPSKTNARTIQDQRTIQFFFSNPTDTRNWLQRAEYVLAGPHGGDGWFTDWVTGARSNGSRDYASIGMPNDYGGFAADGAPSRALAVVPVVKKAADGKVRQFITATSCARQHPAFPWLLGWQVVSYPSDWYRFDKKVPSTPVDTGRQRDENGRLLTSAWTVLGVIEGVPPFTRNGTSQPILSQVKITQASGMALEVKWTGEFKAELKLGGDIPIKVPLIATAETSAALEVANSVQEQTTSGQTLTFSNETGGNRNGEFGFLVVLQPRLQNWVYKMLSVDGHELATINRMMITSSSLNYVPYGLRSGSYDGQDLGLPRRPPTSDPRAWMTALGKDVDDIQDKTVFNECQLDPDTVKAAQNCWLDKKYTTTDSNKTTVQVKLSGGLKNLFAVGVGFTGSYSQSSSTTFNEKTEVSIQSLPMPPASQPDPMYRLEMTAYWVEPKWTTASSSYYWIPPGSSGTPWLITWRISGIRNIPIPPVPEGETTALTLNAATFGPTGTANGAPARGPDPAAIAAPTKSGTAPGFCWACLPQQGGWRSPQP